MVMSTLPHAAQLRVVRVVVVLHSFPAHHRRQCREKSGGRDRGCWVKSGKIARCPTLSLLGEDEPVDVFGHASVLIDFVTMGSKRGHSELELRGRQARQERVPPAMRKRKQSSANRGKRAGRSSDATSLRTRR